MTQTNGKKPENRLIVIGGGAAGFFCAVNAARLNTTLQVTIVEKTNKLLSKVKVSGGSRCNVTHACFNIAEMCRNYPRGQNFVRKAFHRFFTTDTIEWFQSRGVPLKTEADGRMFPVSDSSQTIIDCLLQEARRYGVEIITSAEVTSVDCNEKGFRLQLKTEGWGSGVQQHLHCRCLCIATGGYNRPEMFQWLNRLGHILVPPVPSLFTFNLSSAQAGLPHHPITALTGVSLPKVKLKIEASKLAMEGPLLITHWGLSGPAVLRLSAWGARELHQKNYQFKLHINWLPQQNEQALKQLMQRFRLQQPSKKIINENFGHLPKRLWEFLLEQSSIDQDLRFADLTAKAENLLIKNLTDYIVDVKGKTTFKEEFVTAGGIDLKEVDANSMMSKKIPNLYFAGEVLDVDGITGGFNFQHAWTSGWIAADSIAKSAQG